MDKNLYNVGKSDIIYMIMKLDLKSITHQQRLSAWKNLPEPKPSWESFKRLLVATGGDVFATRTVWLAKKNKTPSS